MIEFINFVQHGKHVYVLVSKTNMIVMYKVTFCLLSCLWILRQVWRRRMP